ncbi:DNA-binding SCF ubiquitin ligase subunit DIA2 NDAI_0F00400 [Naumovozyma dairenensis CBS 421]|uniref:F-box domain-containing protein n=1 Tax=Naumovozyma dairenensis (strain ATCC 10597 / BCRC 20456 / CBS 421 / NBRC 0211 / NRRL Y-12639) TaxID=1071378 RepID=G0WC48_NAUDC|nr:hypothetical protein NDAI_0F00400 [Naumovozyma dairenensis CBS 421]CCD25359.1 hypothetical protein NDAI_0F00400 [Naumovozyma dairenensis CBS 421]
MPIDDSVIQKAIQLGTTYFQNENYEKAKQVFEKAIILTKSYSYDDLLTLRSQYGLDPLPTNGQVLPPPSSSASSSSPSPSSSLPKPRIYHPKYIKLLDNRAACWEKMGELEKALRDATKMCFIEPYNLKCFIRKGKILQKLHKLKDAYNTYKTALRNANFATDSLKINVSKTFIDIIVHQKNLVKDKILSSRTDSRARPLSSSSSNSDVSNQFKRKFIDPIREQRQQNGSKPKRIKSQSNIEESSNKPAQNIDFIAKLPLDIMPLVFQQFSTKQLIQLSYVSKTWHSKIFAFPHLFKDFNLNAISFKQFSKFDDFIKMIPKTIHRQHHHHNHESIDSQLIRSHPIRTLHISSKSNIEETKLCKNLFTTLQNNQCDNLKLVIPNTTTHHLARYIIPKTRIVETIKKLSLMMTLRADYEYECQVLTKFQNLRNLEVLFVNSMVPVNESFDSIRIEFLSENQLKHLESIKILCDSTKIRSFPFVSQLYHIHNSNIITHLTITGVTLPNPNVNGTVGLPLQENQFSWLKNFPNLKTLWLENNQNGQLSQFMKLLRDNPNFHNLERLTFRELATPTGFGLEPVQDAFYYHSNLKALKELDLMGSSINGIGLTRLISYCLPEELTKLNIGDCPFIKLQRFPNDNDSHVLSSSKFFDDVCMLKDLCLCQNGWLNDNSVKLLMEQAPMFSHLEKLDLSMNAAITGVSIYEFLKELKDQRDGDPLDYLIIDRCESISHITVNSIKATQLVKKVDCVYERENWRKFGINSYRFP